MRVKEKIEEIVTKVEARFVKARVQVGEFSNRVNLEGKGALFLTGLSLGVGASAVLPLIR